MVQLQLLLVSLAAVASVSAVPANQQRINPNFAPKPGQKFQQKFGANKGKAPAAMWFQPGGVPNKYRPSAGGAASFRGRPGRRPNKGGNNGAGNAGAGNGNAGAGNGNAGAGNANAGAGNGNQNNAGGNGNNNNAGTGNNNNNNNAGGNNNNAVDGAQDTGIANVVELCTNPDGSSSCFLILGDTKGSCFTIPHPIADNVQFFLPPPGGTCSLFDDQDCNAAALAPAQGVVAQNAKLAWSCTAAAAAAPPATTTTTTAATTTTTTTSSAAATTTSKANNGGKGNAGKGNAGKGNAGKGNAGKGNTGANTGAAKGNTGAAKGNTGAGNTGTGAAKGNTGAAKGNTGAAKGNTGAAAGAGKGNTGATAGKGNQANAGSGSGTNTAVAGSQNLDFGSCSNPTIQFAQGLPGRNAKEFGFQAVNTQDFPHGAALNIGVITDFVCLQFINKCGLKQDSPTIAACRAAEQAALPLQGGAAADAFNKGLGFETNFAAVGGNGNNGGNNNGNNGGNNGNNNGNNGGNNNGGNNGGNNGANGQTDSGVANVIEGCTNPDGATRCFQILADTKESCFTLPPPLANNVAFWLPPPGANCVLFTDQDCTSTPTTAFGVINNVKQNSWSCKLNDA